MDGTNLPFEKDKVVLELFRDSFFHITTCVKDEIVLPEIRPKFPDLEEDYEKLLHEDEKYILFKTIREELIKRWGQHIDRTKKANTKLHECEQILKRIWDINRNFKINIESLKLPAEEQNNSYFRHLKILYAVEPFLESIRIEQKEKPPTVTREGQNQTATKGNIDERPRESNDSSKDERDSDNDDIQTSDNPRQRQNESQDESSSSKTETESIDSGIDEIKNHKTCDENLRKEEPKQDQAMDTSETSNSKVVIHEEIKKLHRHNEELKTKLEEKTKAATKAMHALEIRNKEVVQMTVKIEKLETSNNDLENKIESYESNKKSMEQHCNQIELENRTFKDEIESISKLPDSELRKRVKMLQDRIKKYQTAYNQQKEIIENLKKENETLQQRLAPQRPQTAPVSYAKEYRDTKKQVESLKAEKESLMQRLSMVAGRKMKDNNPAIADLSDSNRPEKLSEKFREIYDNAWTDVLDYITDTDKVQDDVIVKEIVWVLQQIYDQCKDQITKRKLTIIKAIGYPEDTFQKQYSGGKDGHDPNVKIIKDLVQGSANRICDNVIQDIKDLAAVTEILQKGKKKADEFVTKCSMLCLLMVVQDPPVVLDFSCKHGDPFNKDLFSPFTSSGDVIDYLVWPVMFLSENGALMSKGIAQGKKKKKKKKQDEEK
ncbi:unnamed protein product [Mytilus coruscus]|uniref:Mitochondria-eating protein n=1 Tax=Mytilus coruscus TaxID=42192 RepID=A0A6J8A5M1_MYTCO|nr:unnamed protein product [Mytilus coruscus]